MSKSLSLYDFRDLDLMTSARDVLDERGRFTANDLAEAIGFEDELRNVAIRLSWMRRKGVFLYDTERKEWDFTRRAEQVLEAVAADLNGGEELDEPAGAGLVLEMARVRRQARTADPMTAELVRREFLFGTRTGLGRRGNGRRR